MTRASAPRTGENGFQHPGSVLDADLARRLCQEAWGLAGEDHSRSDPTRALGLLRRSLQLQRRADLEQMHPSWWVRALKDESPAVQRLVAADGPPALTRALLAALPLAPDDLTPDRDPDPEVRAWVVALWAERLVGGEPLCGDEPPAIVALAGPPPLARLRLLQVAGLAKVVLAELDLTGHEGPLRRERRTWLSERLGAHEPRVREWARRNLQTLVGDGSLRGRSLALLGLATVARLLTDCDPFRVRWTLQHLPYPIAKRARSLMPQPDKRSAMASQLEDGILKTAWQRLTLEGRISPPHPENRAKESDDR